MKKIILVLIAGIMLVGCKAEDEPVLYISADWSSDISEADISSLTTDNVTSKNHNYEAKQDAIGDVYWKTVDGEKHTAVISTTVSIENEDVYLLLSIDKTGIKLTSSNSVTVDLEID